MLHNRFGFSTGALEKGDYRSALSWLQQHHVANVELSALRYEELEPLVQHLDNLPLRDFEYVSFHAPSSFPPQVEEHVLSLLDAVYKRGWNIIVHPDVIYTPSRWQRFGRQLLIENMDRRKTMGRTVPELSELLERLPAARVCLDVAHARQLDTTLSLLRHFASHFKNRIAEVHISDLDSHCRHKPLSQSAVAGYRECLGSLGDVPVIIESMLDQQNNAQREQEVSLARFAMGGPKIA